MKKIFRRYLGLFVLSAIVGALVLPRATFAAGWVEITSPTSNNLLAIDCYSVTYCVAVGESGTVLYTPSAGSWSLGSSGTSVTLRGVDMVSTTTAIAVGDDGTIIKTTDRGATWSALSSGETNDFYTVVLPSTSVGYVAGSDGKVLKTTDGGSNWSSVPVGGPAQYRAIDALNTSIVWVAAESGIIYRTADGGSTWTDASYSSAVDIEAIDVLTASMAVIGGDGSLVAKSTDSGASWSSVTPTGIGSSETVVDLSFWTSNGGVAIGSAGSISGTTDNAVTWSQDTTLTSFPSLTDATSPSVGIRYVVGASGFIGSYDTYGPSAPTDLTIDGQTGETIYTDDDTPTMSWSAAVDALGTDISLYEFSTDDQTTWSTTDSPTSHTLTSLSEGSYDVAVRGEDALGNSGDEVTATLVVDLTAPTVGTAAPITATAGTSTTFTVTASDSLSGMDSCTLYAGTSSLGSMTYSATTGYWSVAASLSSAGSYSLFATCLDEAGNSTSGTAATLTVSASSSGSGSSSSGSGSSGSGSSEPSSSSGGGSEPIEEDHEAQKGDLLKISCSADSEVNDPCRAVYYFGNDGTRHAFPNEKVYFSWYDDFNDVVIISDEIMASIRLGSNVTYRPGVTMVKFVTVNTVYVVGTAGELRAIDSESTAAAIYGSDWNKKIDDISDAFFPNYIFGDDVDDADDYDPEEVEASAESIDDILHG